MKGQLSAEMLVVLVVVLGIAIILASAMMKSAKNAESQIEKNAGNAFNTSSRAPPGAFCTEDGTCDTVSCDTIRQRCN